MRPRFPRPRAVASASTCRRCPSRRRRVASTSWATLGRPSRRRARRMRRRCSQCAGRPSTSRSSSSESAQTSSVRPHRARARAKSESIAPPGASCRPEHHAWCPPSASAPLHPPHPILHPRDLPLAGAHGHCARARAHRRGPLQVRVATGVDGRLGVPGDCLHQGRQPGYQPLQTRRRRRVRAHVRRRALPLARMGLQGPVARDPSGACGIHRGRTHTHMHARTPARTHAHAADAATSRDLLSGAASRSLPKPPEASPVAPLLSCSPCNPSLRCSPSAVPPLHLEAQAPTRATVTDAGTHVGAQRRRNAGAQRRRPTPAPNAGAQRRRPHLALTASAPCTARAVGRRARGSFCGISRSRSEGRPRTCRPPCR